MAIRNLVPSGSSVLSETAKRVDALKFAKIDEDERISGGKYLIARMRDVCDTLYTLAKGPDALAANQIGIKDSFYIALRQNECKKEDCDHQHETSYSYHEYINPEIIEYSDDKNIDWEACFSYPEEVFEVERSEKVTMKYQNLVGGWQVEEMTGLDAMIAQHEVDHLNGVTIASKCLRRMSRTEFDSMEEQDADILEGTIEE